MSHTLTPSPSYDPVIVPDGSDNRTAASVDAAFQALANRDDFLFSRTPNAIGVVDLALPLCGAQSSDLTKWVFIKGVWLQGDVTADEYIALDLIAPVGAMITHVKVTLQGKSTFLGGVTHSGLPTVKAKVILESITPGSGISGDPHLVASLEDPSADVATYDGVHVVDLEASEVVDAAKRYIVRVVSESGTNSRAESVVVSRIGVTWAVAL